jgi:hypothetical protein
LSELARFLPRPNIVNRYLRAGIRSHRRDDFELVDDGCSDNGDDLHPPGDAPNPG